MADTNPLDLLKDELDNDDVKLFFYFSSILFFNFLMFILYLDSNQSKCSS